MFGCKIPRVLVLVFFGVLNCSSGDVNISPQQLLIGIDDEARFNITLINFNTSDAQLFFVVQHIDILKIEPLTLVLEPFNKSYEFSVQPTTAGHSEVTVVANVTNFDLSDVYLVVNIYKSQALDIISKIAGWIYIISWGCSFYPQIYSNYKRKSVVGLHFDYLALNLFGYVSFGVFISGLYFIPYLQQQYFTLYPRGLIPVKSNDVVYNLHGTFAIMLTIIQCLIYEKGNQTVSRTAKILIALLMAFYVVCCIMIMSNALQWLTFLYYCSYVKLAITVLKYIPQAYMNYKRKSTSGWSIGLVLLDLNGGVFSILQMILDAHNYNDWESIFGNATKFGLGICNIVIHSFFILQHYVLYKDKPLEPTKV